MRKSFPQLLVLLYLLAPWCSRAHQSKPVYLSYEGAQPILTAFAETLPAELKNQGPENWPALWPGWVARRDQEIRQRLQQGDEDSLVNLLFFGTSFTRQPRLTSEFLARAKDLEEQTQGSGPVGRAVSARVEDLVRALARPGANERLRFMRGLLEKKGHRFDTPVARQEVRKYLYASMARVLQELARYSKALEEARLGDPSEEFARRSHLFQDRGISLDASLGPNFALEEALAAMRERGLLGAGGIRRVAIVGPGLDFVDKEEGYDFYPPQTIQPFAVMDTLLRLGLARAEVLEVSTFDISPRVNQHLALARSRAQQKRGYLVHLPLAPRVPWTSAALQYWEHFGDKIGDPARPTAVPVAAGRPKVRAVRIRPAAVSRVTPVDLNIVTQHLELPPEERYDLIVATNVFVYYGPYEQSLALANVERMLKPGAFLLSNNAVLEPSSSRTRAIDYVSVPFSERPGDGEQIVWYRRLPD